MSRRSLIVAGAGIGGLTTALALSRAGFDVTILERAAALEEVGAGIQLSPNASRILIGLGLELALAPQVVAPDGMDVRAGRSGAGIISAELGAEISQRYGAPWWVVHRADLQAVLAEAARSDPHIRLATGTAITGLAPMEAGVEVHTSGIEGDSVVRGDGLIGADGLRSAVRRCLGDTSEPVFRGRLAWRATMPMGSAPQALRGPRLGLWLSPGAHLVHYPLRGGTALNVVAFIEDEAPIEGWSGAGDGRVLQRHFAGWSELVRNLIAAAPGWTLWSLADRPVWFGPGKGPVTLLGDAAHPMLPFAAQGGAMAIEDAAVLAKACATSPDDLAAAFRVYEGKRRTRVGEVQQIASRNGAIYHLSGPMAFARDTAMRLLGGGRLIERQDWIYRFRA